MLFFLNALYSKQMFQSITIRDSSALFAGAPWPSVAVCFFFFFGEEEPFGVLFSLMHRRAVPHLKGRSEGRGCRLNCAKMT